MSVPHVVVTAQRMTAAEKVQFDAQERAMLAHESAPRVVISAKRMNVLQKVAFDITHAFGHA